MVDHQKIITSSWFIELPDEYARIGISRGTPRGQSGYRMYRKLAPGKWFKSVTVDKYFELYMEQLSLLDPQQVVDDLMKLAGEKIPALLCFEPPVEDSQWCHRALVSLWLSRELNLAVYEYGDEIDRTGWDHPKMASELKHASLQHVLF